MFNKTIIFSAIACISIVLLWPPIFLLYLSFIITLILKPLDLFIQKYIPSNTISAILSIVIFSLIILSIALLLAPIILQQCTLLITNLDSLSLQLPAIMQKYLSLKDINNYIKILKQGIIKNIDAIGSYVVSSISNQSLQLLQFSFKMYIVLLLSFYMLKEWNNFQIWLNNIIPKQHMKYVNILTTLMHRLLSQMQLGMKGQVLISIFLILYYASSFFMCNFPNSLLYGIIAGLASCVPYLGILFSIMLTSLFTLNDTPSLFTFIQLFSIFIIGNIIESSILVPTFIGNTLRIHPFLLLIYFLFLSYIFGIYGILLFIPTSIIMHNLLQLIFKKCLN